MIEIVSNSPDETLALGKKIASILKSGSVVALRGTLGSGKTYFTKGIALALGIKETLTSPTYTIINEYSTETGLALYHIDAYRLKGDKDFEDLGGLDIIHSDGISIIEWSDLIPCSLPLDLITITFEITGSFSRLIKIEGPCTGIEI
jgi:tRNA threonylcarbamoyladenosine biosynthesis protein TsaE